MCQEVRSLFRSQHPLAWHVVEGRRIFVEQGRASEKDAANVEPARRLKQRFANWARNQIFDRLWRA
ncbi:hypothetical protein CQ12_30480 [Bradyrhizobium jicamae]|uniref:Uncharacterized protein n=1 Tax=Bradyrhizobium jicamae TaxID=280332 RepID=A0A0R3KBS6_9BRAD|nr:hypothetical protein CQ12_30480 [Bradyrhizobium jicamae]